MPPGLGRLPIYASLDYRDRVPHRWARPGSFFIPLYQREALWLGLEGAKWHPGVVVVGADGVNVLTGEPWTRPLSATPQNYVVVPVQPWLDGIRTRAGSVRQFLAMPLGSGYTILEQLAEPDAEPGLQLRAYRPKPGRFPDEPPARRADDRPLTAMRSAVPPSSLGIGAGGAITQKIYPDPYGIETWESSHCALVSIHIVNSEQFFEITGSAPPPTPISAATYSKLGLPWFELWDHESGDLGAAAALSRVRTVGSNDEPSVEIDPAQIRRLRRKDKDDRNGS